MFLSNMIKIRPIFSLRIISNGKLNQIDKLLLLASCGHILLNIKTVALTIPPLVRMGKT